MPIVNDRENRWTEMVGHRGCISPCSGRPLLKTEPGRVWVAAHALPVFLQCSSCGYAPGPDLQPELIKRYLVRFAAEGGNAVVKFEGNGLFSREYPVRQPDGWLAIYSNVLDGFVAINLTSQEAYDYLKRDGDPVVEMALIIAVEDGRSPVDGWRNFVSSVVAAVDAGTSLNQMADVVALCDIETLNLINDTLDVMKR